MTKLAKARNLSTEQTEPQRQQVLSEAEAQRDLRITLEAVGRNLVNISRETGSTQKKLMQSYQQAQTNLMDRGKKLSQSIEQAEKAASSIRWMKWPFAIMIALSGAAAGVLLTIILLIWQPRLIEALWQAAQVLGTVQQ